jgi:hypothetical protein
LTACRTFLSVRPRSLVVRDLQQTAVKARSAVCFDIHCHNCNQIFRLFAGRGMTVISRLPESAPVPGTAVRLSERNIPPAVAPLVAVAAPSSIGASEDTEFEAMFSGESNPVVGSYRPLAHSPMDLLASAEVIPRSYYV